MVSILVINLSVYLMYTFKQFCSRIILLCVLVAFSELLLAQELKLLTSGVNSSLRGLSVVSENQVWCSGSNGMVAKTVDGGNHFRWMQVVGYEKRDFRDIHAFDSSTAIIMAIDAPAVILKTSDGGATWKKVFEDARPGMFLDAMHFDGVHGVVVGDPINNIPFLAYSNNAGESWEVSVADHSCRQTVEGEAFFAASGSNIQLVKVDKQATLFISGGIRSRIFFQDKCYALPLQSGKSYTGANGMVYSNKYKKGVIVGGDFSDAKRTDSAMVVFELDYNLKIGDPISIPTGYKSGVAFLGKDDIVTCGTTGVDKWSAKGNKWTNLSAQSFHAVQSDKSNKILYLCGSKGSIAKLISN